MGPQGKPSSQLQVSVEMFRESPSTQATIDYVYELVRDLEARAEAAEMVVPRLTADNQQLRDQLSALRTHLQALPHSYGDEIQMNVLLKTQWVKWADIEAALEATK